MKIWKKIMVSSGSALATLALSLGVSNSKKACIFWYHQPKEPDGINKFSK